MDENALLPETAQATELSSRCPNCGFELTGRFCAQCGQRAGARMISVRQILADTLEDQLSLNSAVPRTVKTLLLHPGLLTTEYVSGRVARYIPPMRLYLAASLLFFLVLSFTTGLLGGRGAPPPLTVHAVAPAGLPAARVAREVAPPPAAAAGTARSAGATGARSGEAATRAAARDSSGAQGGISIDTTAGPSWLRTRLAAQQRRFARMPPRDVGRALIGGFMDAAPKVVFLLLPLFALLLKLLYVRRRRLYVEHFVFALHLHAVAFLVFTVFALLRNAWLNLGLATWLAVYGYMAMRRVYGQGWFRTTTKFLALGFAYFFVVAAAIAAGTLLVVLTA